MSEWNWRLAFVEKASLIKRTADEALSNATMLAELRSHQPSMTFYDIQASARALRSAADRLDELAARMQPERQLVAAE